MRRRIPSISSEKASDGDRLDDSDGAIGLERPRGRVALAEPSRREQIESRHAGHCRGRRREPPRLRRGLLGGEEAEIEEITCNAGPEPSGVLGLHQDAESGTELPESEQAKNGVRMLFSEGP